MIGNYILEVAITFIEFGCLFFFLYQQDLRHPWMTIALQSIPVTVLITMMNHFSPLSFSAIWIYVVYVSLIIGLFYRRTALKKMLLAAAYLLILLVGEILAMAVFFAITKEHDIARTMIEISHPYRWLYLVAVKVVVACMMVLVKRVMEQNPLFHKRVFVFSLGAISILLGYVTVNFAKLHSPFEWTIYAIVAGMFALILFSVHKWQYAENEKQLLLLQQTDYVEFYDELRKQDESKRRFVHDFQYHCMTLHQMFIKKEYEKGQEYLEQMLSLMTNTGILRYTGNSNLDFMLNYKKSMAEAKGIRFLVDADAVSEQISISPEDMNIIMGNLLDNAIEANGEPVQNDVWICVKVNVVKGMLLITVKNTFDSLPEKQGDSFMSRKQDGLWHGLGIRNVVERVEKNQGWVNFEAQGDVFCAEVTVFLEENV